MAFLEHWVFWKNVIWPYPEQVGGAFLLAGAVLVISLFTAICLRRAFHKLKTPALRGFHVYPRSALVVSGLVFLSCSVAVGWLAAAGPQRRQWIPQTHYEGVCLGVALDISRSMLAAVAPNARETRLEHAKREIEQLASGLQEGDRVALAIFAGTAKLFGRGWTTDRTRILLPQLKTITPSFVSIYGRSGSNIPAAIKVWAPLLDDKIRCQVFLFIFTDGEPEGDQNLLELDLNLALQIIGKAKMKPSIFLAVIGDLHHRTKIPEYDTQGNASGFIKNERGEEISTGPDMLYLSSLARKFKINIIVADHYHKLQEQIQKEFTGARRVQNVELKEEFIDLTPHFVLGYLLLLACICLFLLLP